MTNYPDNTNFAALSRHLGELNDERAEFRYAEAQQQSAAALERVKKAVDLYQRALQLVRPFAMALDTAIEDCVDEHCDCAYDIEGDLRNGIFVEALAQATPTVNDHTHKDMERAIDAHMLAEWGGE